MNPQFNAGNYYANIVDWGLGKSKDKQTPYVQFTVMPRGWIDPADPDRTPQSCPQFARTIFLYLSGGAAKYSIEKLRRLGYNHDDFDHLQKDHPQAFNFDNMEVEVYCRWEDYEGKTRDKWDFSVSGGTMEHQPLESGEIRKLNALFGKQLKQQAKPTTAAPDPEFHPASADDKDIPF